jgi:hypothetical protein
MVPEGAFPAAKPSLATTFASIPVMSGLILERGDTREKSPQQIETSYRS